MRSRFFFYIPLFHFSLNGFFFSKKKEKKYDVHFHIYDPRVSKLLTEKFTQTDLSHSSFTDRAKTILIRAVSCSLILYALYYCYTVLLVHQKIQFLLKEIIRESDVIRTLLMNKESYFSFLSNYSFYQSCETLIFGYPVKQNQGEAERKRIVQEVFHAIKQDFRFQELSALMYTHGISKNTVMMWIEDILIHNYVFV